MIYYNLDKLVRITCDDFRKSDWYYYSEEQKFLWMTWQVAGIYHIFDENPMNSIPDDHIFKNKVVYVKPCVTLYYVDKTEKNYYFEIYDEAKEFAEEIKSKTGVWIN